MKLYPFNQPCYIWYGHPKFKCMSNPFRIVTVILGYKACCCALAFLLGQILLACQSVPAAETPREQASDLIREAESSGTIVLVVIALVVAWMVLLGFIGRIVKVKNS